MASSSSNVPGGGDAGSSVIASSNTAFRKFDEYPWTRDRPFLQGLVAMLGPLSNTFERQKALGVTLQARIWWYKSRLNIDVDRNAYDSYASSSHHPYQPDSALLDKVEEIQRHMGLMSDNSAAAAPDSFANGFDGGNSSRLPEWMVSAPRKVDLLKKADDGATRSPHGDGGGGHDAPYPAHFQAIIEAVTTGKPVPGVKEIPNTVIRQAGILPVGKMQAPRKPWEKTHEQQQVTDDAVGSGKLLDEEFPPVVDSQEAAHA